MSGFESLGLEVDTPSKMVILHPVTNLPLLDKEEKEAFVMLYSSDSTRAQKFERDITTARIRLRNPGSIDGAQLDDERAALLASLTDGWYLVDPQGDPIDDLPFSRAAAERIYKARPMKWLRDQVETFIGNRANFSKASSTS